MPVGSIVAFLIALLVGGLAIYIGASVIMDVQNYSYAVVTALIGAIVWGVVSFFVGWIPLLGPLLVLIAWLGVINWRYPGGWADAAIIGIVAWAAAIVVAFVLAVLGVPGADAIGIPGV